MEYSVTKIFGKKIFDLRKESGLSQPGVGKQIGTSGTIIGRYERGEMTPSIEVAKRFADLFKVTLDYLLDAKQEENPLQDKKMLERFYKINGLIKADREVLIHVIDGLIRDSKARQAYSTR